MRLFVTSFMGLLLASTAAAQFVLSGSSDPSGGTWSGSYGGIGNSGAERQAAASGTPCSVQGPVTWTWTWSGPPPAPTAAMVLVVASANWGGFGGTASDGMNDPYTTEGPPYGPPTDGSSGGTHYVCVPVNAGTMTYTVNPSATAGGGGCAFQVTCTPIPVYLTLTGPVLAGGNYYVAVGQKLVAVVNGYGNPQDTYTWSTPPDEPFSGYNPTTDSAAAPSPFILPGTSSNTLSCYFGTDGFPAISCAYHSATYNQTFNLTASVDVQLPSVSNFVHQIGAMYLLSSATGPIWYPGIQGNPTDLGLWNAYYNGAPWGIYQGDVLTDPAFLTPGGGQWCYAQIVNDTLNKNGGTIASADSLDGTFPYPNELPGVNNTMQLSPADGVTQRLFDDSQDVLVSFAGSATTWNYVGHYFLFTFYLPAADAAGASAYVPLSLQAYTVSGQCAVTAQGSWTWADNGSGWGTYTTSLALNQWPTWPAPNMNY